MDTIDSTAKGEAKENVQPVVADMNAKNKKTLYKGLAIGLVIGLVFGGTIMHIVKSAGKAVGV